MAGLAVGSSLIVKGLLRYHLPEATWRPLVVHLGYPVGFILVVLGQLQMISGNTLTPIVPLLRRLDGHTLRGVFRVWLIVAVANLSGALAIAAILARTPVFDAPVQVVFTQVSQESMGSNVGVTFLRAIFAGWLIALMVWILHAGESPRWFIVALITYVISIGHFAQALAGAVEVFYLAVSGSTTWLKALGGFILPALIGNVLGGAALLAILSAGKITIPAAGNAADG